MDAKDCEQYNTDHPCCTCDNLAYHRQRELMLKQQDISRQYWDKLEEIRELITPIYKQSPHDKVLRQILLIIDKE